MSLPVSSISTPSSASSRRNPSPPEGVPGVVTSTIPSADDPEVVLVECEAGDGSTATFKGRAVVWAEGDPVTMHRKLQLVRSGKLNKKGLPVTARTGLWTDATRNRLAAPTPCVGRIRIPDPLKGRVVAVQQVGLGAYRCVARFTRGSAGTLEAEFVVDHWVPMAGMRCYAAQEKDTGEVLVIFKPHAAVRDVVWSDASYGTGAPMIDDSEPVQEVRDWIAEQGGELERVDDDQRGRVWRIRLDTGRGPVRHVKFPRESWREACRSAGVGWPSPAAMWDDHGPTVEGDDPWALPTPYEEKMREWIHEARLSRRSVEFTLPSSVGFTGYYCGCPVTASSGLPDGKLQIAVLDDDRGQALTTVDV